MEENKAWFQSWFDTDYYHLLYANRDEHEAQFFIQNVIQHLQIPTRSHILDLACGKGRHSVFMEKMGMDVMGVDLSENSIEFAKQFENDFLKFGVHDMRKELSVSTFDFVFNLFTSFGYFDSKAENLDVLKSVHRMLKPNGVVLIDFLNLQKVVDTLVPYEVKVIEGVTFEISKKVDENHIFKTIQITDGSTQVEYMERVQALSLEDFTSLFEASGFKINSIFGNYNLEAFDVNSADRLLLIAEKI